MFFQSFLAVFTIDPNTMPPTSNLQLFTQSSTYHLPGVYIGDEAVETTATNPFAIQPVTPVIVPSTSNLLPTILVKTGSSSYNPWTLDF